jgi:hypothetical protein
VCWWTIHSCRYLYSKPTCWYGCQLSVHQPQLSCLHLDQRCADWPRGDTVCATAGLESSKTRTVEQLHSKPSCQGRIMGCQRLVTGTLRCTELVGFSTDQFIGRRCSWQLSMRFDWIRRSQTGSSSSRRLPQIRKCSCAAFNGKWDKSLALPVVVANSCHQPIPRHQHY